MFASLPPSTVIFVLGTVALLVLLPRVPTLVAALLAVAALAVCVLIEPNGLLRSVVVGERGGVDLSTGFVFAVASVIMVWGGIQAKGVRSRWMLLMAAVFFVAAGEETSWLQLYFEYSTPRVLEGMNQQGEMTLHNLVSSRVINSAFLMFAAFLFLLGPFLENRHEKAERPLRIFFALFAVYFFVLVLTPRERQSGMVTLIYATALVGSIGFWAFAPSLWDRSRLFAPLRSALTEVRFGQGFLVSAAILFGAWFVYGLRFRCLGDLSFVSDAAQVYPRNIDDELLEYFCAILSVLLAWRQIPGSEASRPDDPSQMEV